MKKLSEHHQLDPRKSGRLNYPEPYLQAAAKTADDLRARFPEAPAETEIMLIGRQGDNYEKDGVKYTHMAFLLRYPSGEMEVCHLINDYSCNKSTIRVNSLEEFFSDGLYKFDHAVWGLDKNRQEGLLKLLYSDLEILHQPKYSAIPSPAMTNYQNCNQWALEMLTAASHPDLLAAPSLEERRAATAIVGGNRAAARPGRAQREQQGSDESGHGEAHVELLVDGFSRAARGGKASAAPERCGCGKRLELQRAVCAPATDAAARRAGNGRRA